MWLADAVRKTAPSATGLDGGGLSFSADFEYTPDGMDDQLTPTSDAGKRLVAAAEGHIADFAVRAEWTINHKAIQVVNHALAVSGGAGYLSKHPLSRLYRDVRAGPFTQPLSTNELFGFVGTVTLGLDPDETSEG